MLERIQDLPGDIAGISAKGVVERNDYQAVMRPLLEDAKRDGRHLRVLYELGQEFERFSPAAVLEDARVGLESVGVMDRFAVVSDAGYVRRAARIVGSLMPCPMRVFGNDERTAAIDWLKSPAEQKGLSHRLLPNLGVIVLRVHSALSAEDFEALELTFQYEFGTHGKVAGLVIQLQNGPRWENLGAFFRHLRFVREHHTQVKRIALVTDGVLSAAMPALAERVLGVEAHHFSARDLDTALYWASTAAQEAASSRGRDDGGATVGDRVHEAGVESFPASDPPAITPAS